MISAEHLYVTRPHSASPVLHDITFHVAKGSILLVCGCNGAGKSTLLHVLGGLLPPDSGTLVCGKGRWPGRMDDPGIALLLQEAEHQILGATVFEDLLLPWPKPSGQQEEKARMLASAYGLADKLNEEVEHLSYGQKRKLCLAAALMTEPSVLLLDEPSCGLDYPSCQALGAMISELRQTGITFVITTHDPDLFLPVLDSQDAMLLLNKGHIFFSGSPQTGASLIREHPELGIRPCGLL